MEVEIKRKTVHALGVFAILFIQILGKYNAAYIFLTLTIIATLIAEYRKNKKKYKIVKIKPVDDIENFVEEEFKEVERPNTLPFKGAIELGLGFFIATLLFKESIAMACIAVVSLSDSLSTLVGYYYGKHKLPVNKKKTFEGSTTFFISTLVILILFTNPLDAFLLAMVTTLVEMLPNVDDNLSIPLVLGILMSLII